jgi:hypothetical protein
MLPGVVVERPDRPAADRLLGNSVGAIEWLLGVDLRPRGPSHAAGCALRCAPLPCNAPLPLGGASLACPPRRRASVQDSYLVDSASSHMLVSKIKPCMSKYKQLYRETANGSLNQLSFI